MDAIQISGQWYVVRYEGNGEKFTIIDGPYPERHWAASMARLNEIQ